MESKIVTYFLLSFIIHQIASFDSRKCDNTIKMPREDICRVCSDVTMDPEHCTGLSARTITATIKPFNASRCCIRFDCSVGLDLRNCSGLSTWELENIQQSHLSFIATEIKKDCLDGFNSLVESSMIGQAKICHSKIDPCKNVTCPDNSHCVGNDTSIECLCDDGWHGYKCLRYGKFPAVIWLVSIGASTFAVILVTWIFQTYSRVANKRRSMDYGTQ